ncbi:MAG: cadmium-translocating P-type ATPase [Oscillospiraceae bacterium]|nr:cadmium-translocating P-type ATPase [Oscillospiraceae bacterium]
MNKEQKIIIARLASGAVFFAAGILTEGILELTFFITAYAVLGYDVIFYALKNIIKGKVFGENFLMTVATAGAFAIGEHPEAAAVMLFYQVGEFFQELAVTRSEKSITDLMDLRPDCANLFINGEIVKTEPENVNPGDLIIIKPGEKVPLDGIVTEGTSTVDTSALTGESAPRFASENSEVISGCVNLSGVLKVQVTKAYSESTAAKILELTRNAAEKKAETESFITSFARIYTPVVVGLALLLAFLPPLLIAEQFMPWIKRALVFLVISCPCALVISVPLGFFAGIGAASKKGILVKGGNFLEALAKLEIIAFDKTGTLTKGNFKVTDIIPAPEYGFTESQLLEAAARAEAFSAHPIAIALKEAFGGEINCDKISDYEETAGKGVSAFVDNVLLHAGSAEFMRENSIALTKPETISTGTTLYIAVGDKYAGAIIISDELKEDAKAAVSGLRKTGVKKIIMLTGDNAAVAGAVAAETGVDDYKAGLLPHEKAETIGTLIAGKAERNKKSGKIAFAGDGVNDAPVLAIADIGVAMGALGSDAAIETADVVLMTDEPSKLIDAVKIAKRTKITVTQNIVLALGFKIFFLSLGAAGIAGMREAVFADVGISLIAVLNSVKLIKI